VSRRRFAILAVALVAVNAFFWLAQGGFALPQGLIQDIFGPRLIRAEVVWQSPSGIQDTQIARGWIRSVNASAITLRERDRPSDTIPLATSVNIRFGTQTMSVSQLLRGMRVVVIRSANVPADTIVVETLR
jgi:hypothetical protein